jgi:hypothetical protein
MKVILICTGKALILNLDKYLKIHPNLNYFPLNLYHLLKHNFLYEFIKYLRGIRRSNELGQKKQKNNVK